MTCDRILTALNREVSTCEHVPDAHDLIVTGRITRVIGTGGQVTEPSAQLIRYHWSTNRSESVAPS